MGSSFREPRRKNERGRAGGPCGEALGKREVRERMQGKYEKAESARRVEKDI